MKKRYKGLLILVSGCAVLSALVIFILIPRAAAISLPYRWGNIPLKQPKTIVRQYLGNPADTTTTTDTWHANRESGVYELNITYSTDASASSYKLYFNYHLGFFHKQYLLQENGLDEK